MSSGDTAKSEKGSSFARCSSTTPVIATPTIVTRFNSSQGKWATSNTRNRPPLPAFRKNPKLNRLKLIKTEHSEESMQGLTSHLLNKRNRPSQSSEESLSPQTDLNKNAKRVKREENQTLLFKSSRKYTSLPVFDEGDIFEGRQQLQDILHKTKTDEDIDSDFSDLARGVQRTLGCLKISLRKNQELGSITPRPLSQSSLISNGSNRMRSM